jgi:hypothetical protein
MPADGMRFASHSVMADPKFRDHLSRMHSVYRGMVESGRLDDLDREMGKGEWLPSANGVVSSVDAVIVDTTNEIMNELHAAAANRNKRAARKALDRLRQWIANIAP